MQIKTSCLGLALIFFVSTFFFIAGAIRGDFPLRMSAEEKADQAGISSLSQTVLDRLYKEAQEAAFPYQFEKIAQQLADLLPQQRANELLRLLLERWVEKDLRGALDFVNALGANDTRQTLLRHALVKAGYFDFRGAMVWIANQPGSSRQSLIDTLYEGIGRENPEYVLGFVDLLDDREVKERITRSLLERWAQQDIAAALSWMNAQELPQAFSDLKASLLSILLARYPQEAGGLIRNMQPGHEKNTLSRKYADLIARMDVQAAAGWARTLDDRDSYEIALTAVYEAWFQKEPDKKLIMEQVLAESDSDLRDRLINEIALDIANNDPSELASIVDRLPASSQPDVAEKAVRFWKDRDPRQTMHWIQSLAPGPVRDRVFKVMVGDLLLRGDREGAMSLAGSIGDRSERYDSVRIAAEQWYRTNPDEARRMVESVSFLSESEKEMISRGLDP